MQEFGKVRVERDKVTTPNGQIPLNADSEVSVIYFPVHQYAKKAAGAGIFAAGLISGGSGWLVAPILGLLFHTSRRVVVTTDGEDFIVDSFGGFFDGPRERAIELREAINREIRRLYAARAKRSK